jgi:hypothetical protein
MTVSWTKTETLIEQAVSKTVGAAWQIASSGASTQFAALIAAGKQIEQKKDTLKQAEYDSLKLMQQRALEGVLLTYQGISLDMAQLAAAAAWTALAGALKSAYPAIGILL